MTETATPESIAHYFRPEVIAVIQRIATEGDTARCGNGDFSRWYTYNGTSQRLFDLSNREDYLYLINRHRTLYWSLNYFEHAAYLRDEPKQAKPSTLGQPFETTNYTLGIDIDHCDGTDIHTFEVKQAVEDMAQFYCDELRKHQPKSVFSCYSGGGIYVYLHHGIWSSVLANTTYKDKSLFVIVNCFNSWIASMQEVFFELHPEHKDKCKADALNNSKRVFKSLLSIHKSLPYSVIPLNIDKINISFDNAKLPLSLDIIKLCDTWYIPSNEPNLIQYALIPYYEENEAKYDNKGNNKPVEISKTVFGEINTFPPCIRAIINSGEIPVGKTRAITILATFLGQVGWDEQQAKDLFFAVAADMKANTSNIFESWFKKMKCPSCNTIKAKGKGFPDMAMGDTKFCTPDSKCKTIKSPFRYVVPEEPKEVKEPQGINITNPDASYHWTDLGNAQRLKNTYGNQFRYCHPMNKWLVWDLRRWNLDNEAYLSQVGARGIIRQLYEEAFAMIDLEKRKTYIGLALKCESSARIAGMVELAKSEPGIPVLPDKLDKDPMLFNVQNGTIDLRTGKMNPHTKENYITKISPVTYDEQATCPTWLSFLNKIFDNKKDIIEYMQRKSGYILSGMTSEEEFDQYVGSGGNGKSKYVNQLLHIMGEYAMKINVETIQAASDRTSGSSASSDVARLKGARFIVVSEPSKGTILNESRVKDWTGRDPITARHLYQEPITYMPEFKLIVYTNYKLRIRGTDNGIWRRIKLIPFEITISDSEIDKHLDQKLLAESSGILNWMIEGCLMWQKDGLKVPQEIIDVTQEYREDQDYLGEFFNICTELNKDNECQFAEVFLVYRAYCKCMDISAQQRIAFIDTLESKKFKRVKKEKGAFYRGFNLVSVIHEKYETMISTCSYVEADALTHLTQIVKTFLAGAIAEEFNKTASSASGASGKQPTDNDNFSTTLCNGSVIENLDRFIVSVSEIFIKRNGNINSSNYIDFSMWFCGEYKPEFKQEGKLYEYKPSLIQKITRKVFGVTP